MKTLIRTTMLVALLVTVGGSAFGAQVSIGISIGPPPRTQVVHVVPVRPAPEYIWVQGYWYPVGNHYKWHEGYWTRPPYPGARWIAPRYDRNLFFVGYWDGDRGRFDHDHRWDRDRDRDRDRGKGNGNGKKNGQH